MTTADPDPARDAPDDAPPADADLSRYVDDSLDYMTVVPPAPAPEPQK